MDHYINYEEKDLSYQIIGAALELHKKVGPRLFESTYESTLACEHGEAGLDVKQQVPMSQAPVH